jgi:hypothetical protein
MIDETVKRAPGIAPSAQQGFADKLRIAIVSYRVRMMAHQQERPAALVAALKPVLKAAKALQGQRTLARKEKLLRRLFVLPDSLRLELRAGGIEKTLRRRTADKRLGDLLCELIERGEAKQRYWEAKVEAGAPTGSAAIGATFRELLLMILEEYWPNVSERKRRSWAGGIWAQIGDAALDPKKHAKRFKAGFVGRG